MSIKLQSSHCHVDNYQCGHALALNRDGIQCRIMHAMQLDLDAWQQTNLDIPTEDQVRVASVWGLPVWQERLFWPLEFGECQR